MPKTAMDYQKTIIYQLKCNDDNITEIYVGHTTNFLKRRQYHKNDCKNQSKLKVHKTIIENGGWDNWKMLEICKYPCLDRREAEKKEEEVRMELKAGLNSQRCWTDNKCIIDGCNKFILNNNMCLKHGAVKLLCSVVDCQNGRINNGLCRTHGAVLPKCSIIDCEKLQQKNGLCRKHNPNKEKYTCICGSEILNHNHHIKVHNNTKKHLKYLETLNNNL